MKDHRSTAIGRCCAVILAVAAALIPVPGLAQITVPGLAQIMVPGLAHAVAPQPAAVSADGSHIDHTVTIDARRSTVYVYSAAMNRVVALDLIRAADTSAPRPTLYLLDGAEDGIGPGGRETSWETQTD